MEPIPEDVEMPSLSTRTNTGITSETKSLLREVYTSEQVDTLVR